MMSSQLLPKTVFCGYPEKIALAYPAEVLARLGGAVEILPVTVSSKDWQSRQEALAEAEFIFGTWGMPKLSEEFLAAVPKLRGVFYGAGSVKGFATEASYARGVVICSSWMANAIPVAEYSLAIILLSLKNFWQFTRDPDGRPPQSRNFPITGCYHSTVGLVSLGAIGKHLAKLLKNFDLHVIAYDPFLSTEMADEFGVEMVGLDAIFERADVVSLHTPWLPETEGMIHGDLMRKMKPHSTLINSARGAILRESDLYKVFSERPDLTAILDVTHPEPPLADSPLLYLKNVMLTPHIAGSVGGEIARMGDWMVDELFHYLAGEPLKHQVTQPMLKTMA